MSGIRRIKPYVFALVCCAALVACRAFGIFSNSPVQVTAQDREVLVTWVIDGDTFETSNGERVRLLGIDAPEVSHHDVAGEPFGEESAAWLRRRIADTNVTLRFGPELTDHYGRTLAWIYSDDNVLINQEALQTGHAELLDRFGLPENLEPQLRAAEHAAKSKKIGLWKQPQDNRSEAKERESSLR